LPTIVFSHQGLAGGITNSKQVCSILEQANQRAGKKQVIACLSGHHHADYVTKLLQS